MVIIRAISPMPRPSAISGHLKTVPLTGRRERHRVQTRDRLYRAALDLFAQRGFLETTVEDITEAADVGKGTFFNYFPTKEHILAEFGGERVAAVERALEKARKTKGPVTDVIRELAGNAAGQSEKSAALLRAIFAAHASCKPVRDELVKRSQIAKRILTDIFLLAQERGEIRRNIAAADLARLTQIVFMGATISWSLKEPHSSLRKTCEEIWDLICPNLEINDGRSNRANRASTKVRRKS
jgi:AcrR family transcriptional regulator